MKLCRVVGAVWGAKEAGSLGGRKLLAVRPVAVASGHSPADIAADGERPDLQDGLIIALDQLGAGIGEFVLVAHGSRVRDLTLGPGVPTKDVVVAIVDSAHVELDLLADEPVGTAPADRSNGRPACSGPAASGTAPHGEGGGA
ncbi:MAG: hypothetical protein FJ109_01870 [Deltaproteobacteria bacterium]|nr:hypothetical protein [Deltaproteobacteria bacterium]